MIKLLTVFTLLLSLNAHAYLTGGSGGGTWGTIQGSLSNQTDLETRFGVEQNASHAYADSLVIAGIAFPVVAPEGGIGTGYCFSESGTDTCMYSTGDGNLSWSTNGGVGMTLEGGTLTVNGNIAANNFNAARFLPNGGGENQVLAKLSNSDYDTGWVNPAPPTGNANTVAAFGPSGALASLDGTQVTAWNGVLQSQTVDPAPDPMSPTGFQMNNLIMNVIPSDDTYSQNIDGKHWELNFDPTDTGFDVGDNSNGNHNGFVFGVSHRSSGKMGQLSGLIVGYDVGSDSIPGGSTGGGTVLNANVNVHVGHTTKGLNGIPLNGSVAGTFSSGGWNGITSGVNFSSGVTGMQFYNGLANFDNLACNMTTGNNAYAFSNGMNLNSGFTAGTYNAFLNAPVFHSGSHIVNYQGWNDNAQFDGLVDQNIEGFHWSPHGSGTITGEIKGASIDLSQINNGKPKIGLSVSDSATYLQSLWDTSLVPQPGGEFQLNLIGGQFHVADGSPITDGSFGFGNNIGPTVFIEDNVSVDSTGIGLGFSVNGLVNQLAVVAGKTIPDLNYMVAGAGIPAQSTGGTVTNLSLFRAIGLLPSGGTLNVTNLYGYKVDPLLDISGATNLWGVHVGATTADNYFAKDVVIGGVTGKPTGAYALDVTGDSIHTGDVKITGVLQLPVQAPATTPTCAAAGDDGKIALTSTHQLCICNGSTPGWFDSSGLVSCTF